MTISTGINDPGLFERVVDLLVMRVEGVRSTIDVDKVSIVSSLCVFFKFLLQCFDLGTASRTHVLDVLVDLLLDFRIKLPTGWTSCFDKIWACVEVVLLATYAGEVSAFLLLLLARFSLAV